jgi:hypothetical protein
MRYAPRKYWMMQEKSTPQIIRRTAPPRLCGILVFAKMMQLADRALAVRGDAA